MPSVLLFRDQHFHFIFWTLIFIYATQTTDLLLFHFTRLFTKKAEQSAISRLITRLCRQTVRSVCEITFKRESFGDGTNRPWLAVFQYFLTLFNMHFESSFSLLFNPTFYVWFILKYSKWVWFWMFIRFFISAFESSKINFLKLAAAIKWYKKVLHYYHLIVTHRMSKLWNDYFSPLKSKHQICFINFVWLTLIFFNIVTDHLFAQFFTINSLHVIPFCHISTWSACCLIILWIKLTEILKFQLAITRVFVNVNI